MGYYLQKVHAVDILKMNVEFTTDDDGVLWLTHAYDISVRFRKVAYSIDYLRQIGLASDENVAITYDMTENQNKHFSKSFTFMRVLRTDFFRSNHLCSG